MLLPVSFAIGVTFHFILSNVMLRFLPVPAAMWSVLIIMSSVGGILWLKERETVGQLTLGTGKYIAVVLAICWIGSGILFYRISYYWENLDWVDTGPRATMYGLLGLPPLLSRSFADYQYCSYSHEAEAIMIGTLATQINTHDLRMVNNIRSSFIMMTVVGLAFVLLWILFKKKGAAWSASGAWLLVTTGPATFLAQIHNFPLLSRILDSSSPIFSQTVTYSRLQTIPFQVNVLFPLTYYMSNPYPASFLVYFLMALLGWLYIEGSDHSWRSYVVLGVIVATSALFFESIFPLIAIPIGLRLLYKVAKARSNPAPALQRLFLFTGTVILLASVQGGLITDVLFCANHEPATSGVGFNPQAMTNFTLTSNPGYQGAYLRAFNLPPVQLGSPSNWLSLLVDWGIGLFLFPIVLVYAFRTRLTPILLLMGCAIPFLLFPFFVVYKQLVIQDNVFRFGTFPIWLSGMFSVFLLKGLDAGETLFSKIIRRSVVVIVVVTLGAVGTVNALYYAAQPQMVSRILSPIDVRVQSEWYGVLNPFRDSVFDPTRDLVGLKSLARTTMIFATYGKRNVRANLSYAYQPESAEVQRWRDTLSPNILQSLGFTYLYVDGTWLSEHSSELLQKTLYDPHNYQLVEKWQDPNTGDTRSLYKILNSG
jgi:hypothetical protein